MGGSVEPPFGSASFSSGELFFEELRAKLEARARASIDEPGLVESCVLVPLVALEGEPAIVLTRRLDSLAKHAGQVAFPGGVRDDGDATPLATALREADEELAIPPSAVTVLGALDDVWVVTGFRITPFVGRLREPIELRPNPAEVARVFTVALRALIDPARTRVRVERMTRAGRSVDVPFFEHEGEVIWGATGRAVLNLLEVALGYVAPPPIVRPV